MLCFQAQTQAFGQAAAAATAATAAASAPPAVAVPQQQQLPYPLHPSGPGMPESMYPGLSSYMGLEFDEQTIRENMPEYLGGGGGALMPQQNVRLRQPSNRISFLTYLYSTTYSQERPLQGPSAPRDP